MIPDEALIAERREGLLKSSSRYCEAQAMPLRANSRSPLQEEYDSEYDHRSRKWLIDSSACKL